MFKPCIVVNYDDTKFSACFTAHRVTFVVIRIDSRNLNGAVPNVTISEDKSLSCQDFLTLEGKLSYRFYAYLLEPSICPG